MCSIYVVQEMGTVQPDSFSTDDAFSTDGSDRGRFKQNVSIDSDPVYLVPRYSQPSL